ncbi:MAG: type II toxin-antitoxin system VapB family antitoxin [Deltaproteobacteria bacterium]|nr:type II toxin-antitoxin system VapB family antitoxin [Deltaproteobacteria bacterium]
MERTNIVLDEDLLRRAMKVTGARTKRQVVDIALRSLVSQAEVYAALLGLAGRLPWDGDAGAMRGERA